MNTVLYMHGVSLATGLRWHLNSARLFCLFLGRNNGQIYRYLLRSCGTNLNVSLLSSSDDGQSASSDSSSSSAAPGAWSAGTVLPSSLAPDASTAAAALNRSDPSLNNDVAAGNSSVNGNFLTAVSHDRGV